MGSSNFHLPVKSQQNPCHWLLASAANQDEAEGDDDGICVQAEPCIYLLSTLDSKIHYHWSNSFSETYFPLFNHEMICTSAFDQHNTKSAFSEHKTSCWAFLRVSFQFQSLWSERWLVCLCHHPSSTRHPLKMSENAEHADKNVEIWKVSCWKRLQKFQA